MFSNLQLRYLRALITKRLDDMDERGASAVEYGLLVAGIAIVVIAAVFLLGHKIKSLFDNTSSTIGDCNVSSSTTPGNESC